MSAERRRHPRVTVDVPVHLTATADETMIGGRVRDVSVDAILVEAALAWPLGTDVVIEFELPDHGGALRLTGRVIRVASEHDGEAAAMAVLFTDLPPAAATSIDLFLATQ